MGPWLAEWFLPDGLRAAPLLYVLAAMAAVFLTGFSKGGFGGGLGVISTPLLLLVLPGPVAVSMMLPLLIVCDFFTLRQFPTHWDRPSFRWFTTGAGLGLFAGFAILLLIGREGVDADRWIRLMVGVVSLGFCLLQLARGLLVNRAQRHAPVGRRTGWGMGLLAGVTTMVAHAAGPVANMFFLLRRLDRQSFVGTSARYFLLVNCVKIPFFVAASVLAERSYLTLDTLRWGLWLIPLCPISVALGAWLNRRLNGALFTRIIYGLLFVTGLNMIVQAIRG